MDPEPICPPWWPDLIWKLHFRPHPPKPVPGPGPVNYPPAIDDMMAALAIHTLSYYLLDQKAADDIRSMAEKRLVATAGQLSALHDKAERGR